MAATLSFAQMPLADYLVDNPVMFELVTPSPEAIDFDVAVDGDTVYSGVFVPSGAAPDCEASVSVQDILQPLFRTPELISDTATVSEVANMFLDFSVEFRQGDETLAHAARAYQGGVSKRMLRFLHDMETDIFQYKLKNPRRQFFMTTRTGGNTIVFPENCLTPLFFIAVDRVYTVTTEFGDTYTFPPLETGRVYAFNIEAFRATFANTPCTLTMQLFLTNRVMIRIVPPAPVPDRLVIEFLNSYKMSERMEVTGKCVYAPELDTDGAYDAYDHVTDSYIERNRRQPLRETLHAAFGYKTPDELLFARDMLQSERRFLITPDGERLECRVASDSFQHDVFPVTPQSVPLKITLSDTEENFTPERSPDDDYLERVFIAVLNVPSGRLQNGLPLSGNVDLAIDWGDGTTETVTADYPRHTYAAQGEYAVAVAGHADYFSQTSAFQNLPNRIQANFRYNMRKIESFGDLGIISASGAFRSCSNLSEVEAAPAYFFSAATVASSMFEACTSLHSTLQEIDSSVLTDVSGMYSNCTSLDTVSESLFSKCRNLSGVRYLFNACTSLVNVPVNLFANSSKLTDAIGVFSSCRNLEQGVTFFYCPDIAEFTYLYQNCASLTGVPDYCFASSNATAFTSVFESCTSLATVPANILSNAAKARSFKSFFKNSGIRSVPFGLLDSCVLATDMTSIFENTPLEDIPYSLFFNNVEVTSFSYAFLSCNSLLALPSMFRYSSKAVSFAYTFAGCGQLYYVPADLFQYAVNATDFSSTFSSCSSLVSVSEDLFRYNTQVTLFNSTFSYSGLTSVPPNLFRYNTQVTSFSATFSMSKLTSVPPDLFRYNTSVKSFNSTFYQCPLTSVPDGLFQYNTAVETFYGVFYDTLLASVPSDLFRYNINATLFTYTFANTRITSVPADLFRYNTLARAFYNTFERCELLTSIPAGLFQYNVNAMEFGSTFKGCSSLASIPAGLFRYNTQAYYFPELFFGCTSLTYIPAGIFDYVSNTSNTTLYVCFAYSGITSVDGNIFSTLTELTLMEGLFSGSQLAVIPAGLLSSNTKLKRINGLFYGTKITAIPSLLFASCPEITETIGVFGECVSLASIPNDLFDSNKAVTQFDSAFYKCESLTGATPRGTDGVALWERAGQPGYPASTNGSQCFRDCTGLADYASIPPAWK